jgi:hypothetical protein
MSPGGSSPGGGAATHEREGAAPSKGAESAPGGVKGQRADDTKGGAKDMKAEGREGSKATETKSPTEKSQKAEGREDRDKNLKAEGREGRDKNLKAEGREGRDNMKAEGREGRDNMKAEGREGRDNMKAEGREGRDNMKAEGREGRDGNRAAEKSTTERSQTTGQVGAGAKLSTEQQTRITSVIRNQHIERVNNVNFSISVGTRVPREGVRFYPLPAEVVTIYPEWRGYQYILVRDEIVVIDPNTYEIVAVLNA